MTHVAAGGGHQRAGGEGEATGRPLYLMGGGRLHILTGACHFTGDTAPRDDGQSAPRTITAKLHHTGTEQTGVRVTLL